MAPHPDDEILGSGGASALLNAGGVEIVCVAVTDGENSHPDRQAELRLRRSLESLAASACLGLSPMRRLRLCHPDGHVTQARLQADLEELFRPGDLVLAPWPHDGHPDHDRSGSAAQVAANRRQATLFYYLVWAWHWASPELDLPWDKAARLDLDPELTRKKRAAVGCFTTQLTGPDPILPPAALERLTRPYEILLEP